MNESLATLAFVMFRKNQAKRRVAENVGPSGVFRTWGQEVQ